MKKKTYQPITPLAIINAKIETITYGRIESGAIRIGSDGRIAAVGSTVKPLKTDSVIDANGAIVTPGLIDAHTHAGLAEDGFLDDPDYNEMSGPVTPQVRALDGFKPADVSLWEAAQSGVTTVYVTPGSANVIGGIGVIVKTYGRSHADMIVQAESGMKMATGENPKRVYGSQHKMPFTRMGIAALFRETFSAAKDYMALKKAAGKQKGKSKKPFETDLKKEAVARVLSGELIARCHSHRAMDMLTFMRIADEYNFRYVFEHATECESILKELSAKNVPVIIGPTLGSRSKRELMSKSFKTVRAAVDAGLIVAVTADHDVTPLRYLNVYAALAVREGLSETDALRTITLNPATILGIEADYGSIEKGKIADVVIWNGDPLDARSRPLTTLIGGVAVPSGPEPNAYR